MSSKLRKALKETIFTFKMSVTRSFNTFISWDNLYTMKQIFVC
jgi:hypothetical protein